MGRPHRASSGRYELKCSDGACWSWFGKFDTNGTSAPDGVMHSDDGAVVARTGAGTFTVTFPSPVPYALVWADASILGDEANLHAKAVSYVQATGVLTIKVYQQADDGADTDPDNGLSAAADTTDKTVQVHCVFSRLAE